MKFLSKEQAEQLETILHWIVLGIGIYMVTQFQPGTPPFLSGLAFIAMGLSELLD